MKKVHAVSEAPRPHWVGDGFHVHSMFSYATHGEILSPFLLLDYGAPREFTPTTHRRGVGEHPHRGFETVTIVYKGEVSHRDSTGRGGTIGPGDVQWMTAASGVLHEEFHSEAFAQRGGPMHMVQLWVNLPAKDKMAAPGYQGIVDGDIPAVDLPGGRVRVIAGEFSGAKGPAHTFTPMQVWDLSLNAGGEVAFDLKDGWNTALIILGGEVEANGASARGAQMVLLDPSGTGVSLKSKAGATLLLLSGEPIDEPIAGYGPFVMNTEDEIEKAIQDFNSGHFGEIPR